MYLLYLAMADLSPANSLAVVQLAMNIVRLTVLAATAALVVLSRERGVVLGASALLLAHFATYHQVWEHHMSGVTLIAAVLLTAWGDRRGYSFATLACMLVLALPTPYVFFGAARNPALSDPAMTWPRAASYLTVLPKVLPVVVLLLMCVRDLVRAGFDSPKEVLVGLRHWREPAMDLVSSPTPREWPG